MGEVSSAVARALRGLDRATPLILKLAVPVLLASFLGEIVSRTWANGFLDAVEIAVQIATVLLVVHFFVVRRLRRLDQAAERVARGDLTVRLQDGDLPEAHDEIARVTAAFDQMTRAVARQHAAIERRADTDALTGLLNRSALDARLEREVAQARRLGYPLAFSLVDLDAFKRLNDARGHLAGDEALRRIGDALAIAVRRTDIVARYGGDEFGVIHPGCDLTHAAAVAVRIRRAIEALRLPLGETGSRVSASVGTVPLREGETITALVAEADEALYRAKRRGGGVEVAATA